MEKPPAEIFSAGGFCCLDGLNLGKIRFGGSHIVVQATDGNLSGGQSLCGAVLLADGQAKVIGNAHGGADALSCTGDDLYRIAHRQAVPAKMVQIGGVLGREVVI